MKIDKCLACGVQVDAVTAAFGDHTPTPGDMTLCLYCGHIMAFANDLRLRELTDAEAHAIAGDRKILAVQKARQEVMKKRDTK